MRTLSPVCVAVLSRARRSCSSSGEKMSMYGRKSSKQHALVPNRSKYSPTSSVSFSTFVVRRDICVSS